MGYDESDQLSSTDDVDSSNGVFETANLEEIPTVGPRPQSVRSSRADWTRRAVGSYSTKPAAVEDIPHWSGVRTIRPAAQDVPARFELRLEDPPVLSAVSALGGYVERATIEDGEYDMRIHLAPSADVRQLIDLVRETYPMAQLVSRQQVSRASASPIQLLGRIADQLTDRQFAALEAAYFAGYFEWPREANGEEVAESFGISAPTFHQHLRSAQRKVFQVVLEDAAAV